MIVMIDECLDPRFQVCWEEVVLQQDAVFQGLVPSLDFALCLRMIRRPPDVAHILVAEPLSQLTGDVAGAVVR